MNNLSTTHLALRLSEGVNIIMLYILGLIERKGQGQPTLTEKFDRLKRASEKWNNGTALSDDELALILECRNIVTHT